MKLGFPELIVVLLIVMILLGPSQIPRLTRMFARSVRSFRDGLSETGEPSRDE